MMQRSDCHDYLRTISLQTALVMKSVLIARVPGHSHALESSCASNVLVNDNPQAPRYPKEKLEGWWVVLGDQKNNTLLAIKRVTLNKQRLDVNLEFEATTAGKQKLALYLICDSYMGCDQELDVALTIAEGMRP
jgi:hypothetical protein